MNVKTRLKTRTKIFEESTMLVELIGAHREQVEQRHA